MMHMTFNALWITETAEHTFERNIVERDVAALPAGELLVKVHYSALNYKDALSASGHKGITRHYPHTPGVDAAGKVIASDTEAFQVGEAVIVSGYDLGMNTPGGFGGYIRVPSSWAIKLPAALSLKDSMIYGTAGFTAAQAIFNLHHWGLQPSQGPILVTGASGGVGSLAVALLAKLGYQVVAMSGKPHAQTWLKQLGAHEIVAREHLADSSDRPLLPGQWAGVIDTVGGSVLTNALRSTRYRGAVACCGLVAGNELSLTVFPFILRGVALLGIDSAACPMELRLPIWSLLAGDWRLDNLAPFCTECDLTALNEIYLDKILQGQIQGRVVVRLT